MTGKRKLASKQQSFIRAQFPSSQVSPPTKKQKTTLCAPDASIHSESPSAILLLLGTNSHPVKTTFTAPEDQHFLRDLKPSYEASHWYLCALITRTMSTTQYLATMTDGTPEQKWLRARVSFPEWKWNFALIIDEKTLINEPMKPRSQHMGPLTFDTPSHLDTISHIRTTNDKVQEWHLKYNLQYRGLIVDQWMLAAMIDGRKTAEYRTFGFKNMGVFATSACSTIEKNSNRRKSYALKEPSPSPHASVSHKNKLPRKKRNASQKVELRKFNNAKGFAAEFDWQNWDPQSYCIDPDMMVEQALPWLTAKTLPRKNENEGVRSYNEQLKQFLYASCKRRFWWKSDKFVGEPSQWRHLRNIFFVLLTQPTMHKALLYHLRSEYVPDQFTAALAHILGIVSPGTCDKCDSQQERVYQFRDPHNRKYRVTMHAWRCRSCSRSSSIWNNTCLSKFSVGHTKNGFLDMLLFIFEHIGSLETHKNYQDHTRTSSDWTTDAQQFLFEAVDIYIDHHVLKLGKTKDVSNIVSIDHKHCTNRKYTRGDPIPNENVLFIGMADEDGISQFNLVATERKPETNDTILKYTDEAAVIHTDEGKAFGDTATLDQRQHGTVCHNGRIKDGILYRFRDPDTGVHSQRAEGLFGKWVQLFARRFPQHMRGSKRIGELLSLYDLIHNRTDAHAAQILITFIYMLTVVYPPNSSPLTKLPRKDWTNHWPIERVVGQRSLSGLGCNASNCEYLVKWEGWSYAHLQWRGVDKFDEGVNNEHIQNWLNLSVADQNKLHQHAMKFFNQNKSKSKSLKRVSLLFDWKIRSWAMSPQHFNLAKQRYEQGYVLTDKCQHRAKDQFVTGVVKSGRHAHNIGPWAVSFRYNKDCGTPIEWECGGEMCASNGNDHPKCIHVLLLLLHFSSDRRQKNGASASNASASNENTN